GPSDRLLARPAGQPLHRAVEGSDAPAAVEDHYTIGALLDNRVELLLIVQHALVEPRVADGDRGLIGEGLEQILLFWRERYIQRRTENIDHSDTCLAKD